MTGCLLGEVPFRNVYLHGLVRTAKGEKMSKSKPESNIDPLDMINKYGADATRLSLIIGTGPGNDVKLSEDKIKGYKSIRLLIGQEPLMPRYKAKLKLEEPEQAFPDKDISFDLATLPQDENYRKLVTDIKQLIADGRLEVRIYRRSFLHAKCYILGDYESESAIGIIGSSNFTRAGLTANTELNALEDDYRIVKSTPRAETDDYGHLSWFDKVWNDELTEKWNGRSRRTICIQSCSYRSVRQSRNTECVSKSGESRIYDQFLQHLAEQNNAGGIV
jgi:hypothetical protein